MKHLLALAVLTICAFKCDSQISKYWVFFTDKEGVTFNPEEYFDQKALDRRVKNGVPLSHISDYPLNEFYLEEVRSNCTEMLEQSRWFNAVSVLATEKEIAFISSLKQVKKIEAFEEIHASLAKRRMGAISDRDLRSINLIKTQTKRFNPEVFKANKIDGSGVRVAVFDAGFKSADINPALRHLFENQRIVKTFDFIKNKENVYAYHGHGTAVLSCIAGLMKNDEGLIDTLGLAHGAEFLLARTERPYIETYSEEDNWIAALEWADKNGADIINSSLGYTGQRYFYKDMNGRNSLVSRAGNLAASKGILVINSAGNDGGSSWNFIGAPADADSVLAVGALNPWTGVHTPFSSVGPTFDRRMKPNVTAYGHVIAAKSEGLDETQGTSFSSPLTAGFAACALQCKPESKVMQLFSDLEKSSDLYPYYDYAHGYGVPQAEYFINRKEKKTIEPTIKLTIENGEYLVRVLEPGEIKNEEESLMHSFFDSTDCILDYEDMLFYKFENQSGEIISYFTVHLKGAEVYPIAIPESYYSLTIYYEGYSLTTNN